MAGVAGHATVSQVGEVDRLAQTTHGLNLHLRQLVDATPHELACLGLPDIELENLKIAESDGAASKRLKEADLARHLEGDGERKQGDAKAADKTKDGGADKSTPLAKRDYAIYEALNLLKGLAILQKHSS